jgi:hypothetical protein
VSDLVESSVASYSPDSKDVSIEAEEASLLESVARELLVKTVQTGKDLVFAGMLCKVWKSAIVL